MASRFVTVRVRVTAGATLAAAVVLAGASVVLVGLVRQTLVDGVTEGARLRADEVAIAISAGASPPLAVAESDELLIQVVDGRGRIVASSTNARTLGPVTDAAPGSTERLSVPLDEDPFVAVTAAAVSPEHGRATVIVARALSNAEDAAGVLAGLLAVGVPVLTALIGGICWVVVGRALRPVETMRREAEAIGAGDLARRLPRPDRADEIGRLSTTMNAMLGRLEASVAQQQRLVADAAHELRSPVAAIRQHAEVALAHPDATPLPELAATVLREDLRIQQLVDDLLLAAQADEGVLNTQLRREPVDVDDIVFAEARRLRESTSLRVDTRGVSGGRVAGDRAALRRVVRNLADNAIRHARTAVAFTLSAADGTVRLHVDDDGAGVAPADRQRVFDRFVRLDEARARDAGGSGLGLAIVADLVDAHRGSVEVGDSPLGGARLVVLLPALDR